MRESVNRTCMPLYISLSHVIIRLVMCLFVVLLCINEVIRQWYCWFNGIDLTLAYSKLMRMSRPIKFRSRGLIWYLDFSYLGLFVPWTVRTLLDCSYHGLFVPSLDDSYRDAILTKINVSYQNVPEFSVSQTP